MEELKDVVLMIYTLPTDSPELGRTASFFGRLLPSMGMGAYHTSLKVDGSFYTFAANRGIVRTTARNDGGVPQHALFREALPLGSCRPQSRGEIQTIVTKLEAFFSPTAYHLVHRNCNHFTETLATALILKDNLLEEAGSPKRKKLRLDSYPTWVNRLANTGAAVVSHEDDVVPCLVLQEACHAVGAHEHRTSWNLTSNKKPAAPSKKAGSSSKKQLTEKQKAILAKMGKK